MNWSKPVLKWLGIVLCIIGCEPLFFGSLYWPYGPKDFFRTKLLSFPYVCFVSLCLVLAVVCFVLYRFDFHQRWLKPVFKWVGISGGVLAAVLILFLLEENIRGRIELRSYLRELRARGEKLTLAEISIPKPAKGDNGAVALTALTNQFESLRTNSTFGSGSLSLSRIRLVGQGRGVVRTAQPDLGVNRQQLIAVEVHPGSSRREWPAPVKADWTDLDAEVSKASNVLEQVRQALRQPIASLPVDYSQGYQTRHTDAYAAAHWLGLAALSRLRHRDMESATQCILDIAILTHFGEDERLFVSQVNRRNRGLIGLSLTWEALQIPGFTDEQLLALENAWQDGSLIHNTASILEVNRLFDLSQWSEHRTNIFCYWRWEGWPTDFGELVSDLGDSLHATAWQIAWVDQDEACFLNRYQAVLERTRSAITTRNWSILHHREQNIPYTESVYDRMRFVYAPHFIGSLDYALDLAFEYETQREMTVAAIAINRYHLRYRKLPPDLSALVPEYVPQLPHDWMDGQPLRYRVNADGTFTLYSVGLNGRDDGGDPSSLERWRASSIWQERDAVWPMPASMEEVALAERRR